MMMMVMVVVVVVVVVVMVMIRKRKRRRHSILTTTNCLQTGILLRAIHYQSLMSLKMFLTSPNNVKQNTSSICRVIFLKLQQTCVSLLDL
jgi:hypothetical protein